MVDVHRAALHEDTKTTDKQNRVVSITNPCLRHAAQPLFSPTVSGALEKHLERLAAEC